MKKNLTTKVLFCFRKKLLKIVMRTFIFLFCFTVLGFAPNDILSQDAKITIDADKIITVDEVFKIIKEQTDYRFIYESGMFDNFPKVNLKKGIVKANKLLKMSFLKGPFNFSFSNENTIVITENPSHLQQITITGKVVDSSDGLSIPGVAIYVTSKQLSPDESSPDFIVRSTSTDFDGNFSMLVETGYYLNASSIGFSLYTEKIVANKTIYNITLQEKTTLLDEVVFTGYQRISPNKSTGSTENVDGAILERKGNANILQSLEGQIPGLVLNQDPTQEGATNFSIRGVTSLAGDARPLIVVDGFPIQADLSSINPYEVETITVLKDAAAASIYGARSANGVIVITTKSGKVREVKSRV